TCTLDVLLHLPRATFSMKHMDLIIYLLRVVTGKRELPSARSVKDWCKDVQKLYGIDTFEYSGVFGHPYSVNSLNQILMQELANPRVRRSLSFIPEDSYPRLSEARQGTRWLKELPPELTTPSQEIGPPHHTKVYFTFEITIRRDETYWVPVRWFQRGEDIYAVCWKASPVWLGDRWGWQADVSSECEVKSTEFAMPWPELKEDMLANSDRYNAPAALQLDKLCNSQTGTVEPWPERYSTKDGNPWRVKSGGAPVVALPLWMYCDDTSGNKSKKWNKHNSWLFTLAGLPRREVMKESNVHFLATSNLAPPLEMLDGIVDQIKCVTLNGVWAWDCGLGKAVMFFPLVLALLGDNPMQSEFACHVGLRGRKYCRACHASKAAQLGSSPAAEYGAYVPQAQPSTTPAFNSPDYTNSPHIGSFYPDAALPSNYSYSYHAVFRRLNEFVEPGASRNQVETKQTLLSYFAEARSLGKEKVIRGMRTSSGVKDTFQLEYLSRIFGSYKRENRGVRTQAQALADWWTDFDESQKALDSMINPMWRLEGLDAHQDTPVEILHVVLLGMVKYFWRDVIKHQLKDKAPAKQKLATRLSSFEPDGLGISRLRGDTLTQYAGSLVGRDFRAVVQAAPFVLKGMVSEPCYDTWVCLSKLVPLIWQPEIANIDVYLATLSNEIKQFLLLTARWTGRWFNKPKFHILVHLPEHVRRFGPAILFATESFESFNAIIRAKSIHSNRQAPSRDIAVAFSQWNRLRHFASGGYFIR
ncbi:hypothetical protein FA13DRAFT_1600926, partial [Coprinellus micaceus]